MSISAYLHAFIVKALICVCSDQSKWRLYCTTLLQTHGHTVSPQYMSIPWNIRACPLLNYSMLGLHVTFLATTTSHIYTVPLITTAICPV